MNQQPTLGFDTQSPVVRDTRARAHAKARPSKNALHISLIKDFYSRSFNADAWAAEKGLSILSVRPRVSEINKAGLLHRVAYGLTQDGNDQDVFTLYPLYRERMKTLVERFGIDKAAEQIVTEFIR
jgi:hypothetical protein